MSKSNENKEDAFILVGKQSEDSELEISETAGFYDAVQLSRFPEALQQPHRYRFIPLQKDKIMALIFLDRSSKTYLQLGIHNQTLQLSGKDPALSHEKAYKTFSSFLIRRGDKLLFLTNFKNVKIKNRKKTHSLSATEAKNLKNKEENNENF